MDGLPFASISRPNVVSPLSRSAVAGQLAARSINPAIQRLRITPGSVFGMILWLGASVGLRAYLHFFNTYSAAYGLLGAVMILRPMVLSHPGIASTVMRSLGSHPA